MSQEQGECKVCGTWEILEFNGKCHKCTYGENKNVDSNIKWLKSWIPSMGYCPFCGTKGIVPTSEHKCPNCKLSLLEPKVTPCIKNEKDIMTTNEATVPQYYPGIGRLGYVGGLLALNLFSLSLSFVPVIMASIVEIAPLAFDMVRLILLLFALPIILLLSIYRLKNIGMSPVWCKRRSKSAAPVGAE